jgi:hypothetical protein
MFGFYNNYNNNNYFLKIKVDCLINDNVELNCEIKQLNRSIKKLKNDYYINNIKKIEALQNEINTIKLKNDYYMKNIKTVIDVLKNDINTIKLKKNYNDINNDDFIQI